MVIKISSDYIDLAHEIKVLKKIAKHANGVKELINNHGLPKISTYQVFVGVSPHKDNIKEETIINLTDDKVANLFGYYIMPKYKMTLDELII